MRVKMGSLGELLSLPWSVKTSRFTGLEVQAEARHVKLSIYAENPSSRDTLQAGPETVLSYEDDWAYRNPSQNGPLLRG